MEDNKNKILELEKEVEQQKRQKKQEKDDVITISKSDLDKIYEKLDMLQKVADKSRLDNWEKEHKELGPAKYRVSTIDGKIIVGWRTIKDEVYRDPVSNIMRVTQAYEFILEDGSTYPVNGYNNFASLHYANQLEGKEMSKTIDANGTILKLELDNGKVIEIDSKFVN